MLLLTPVPLLPLGVRLPAEGKYDMSARRMVCPLTCSLHWALPCKRSYTTSNATVPSSAWGKPGGGRGGGANGGRTVLSFGFAVVVFTNVVQCSLNFHCTVFRMSLSLHRDFIQHSVHIPLTSLELPSIFHQQSFTHFVSCFAVLGFALLI